MIAVLLVVLTLHWLAGPAAQPPSAEPWTRHVIDASSKGADGVRAADVNGDGLPDFVVGWEQGGITRIYLSSRSSQTRPTWRAVTAGKTPDVEDGVFFDADGDGVLDVISSTEGETRRVLVLWAPRSVERYAAEAEWTAESLVSNGSRWMFAMPMDIDQRRGRDLVIGGKDDGASVAWLEAPADPRRVQDWTLHRLSDAGWIMSLIREDMNHDGHPDILLSDRRGPMAGVRWLQNPGPGSTGLRKPWKSHMVGAAGREAMFIETADLDGDGVKEIVVPHYFGNDWRLSIFKSDSTVGRENRWREYSIPYPAIAGRPKSAAVGDIDLDGRPDIALASEQAHGGKRGIVWLRSRKSPFDSAWDVFDVSGPDGVKFDLSLLLDLDGDGDLDIINSEENDNAAGGNPGLGVVWYENPTRALTFAAAPAGGEWSRFRGPNGSGLSETTGLPAEFGPGRNVIWKTDLPQGYSSPIVHGTRIFLTGFRADTLLSFAVDRSTGKVLWEREAPRARKEKLDKRNHPAAASAATDGDRVYFFFADYGLLAYDVNGTELWRQPLGPFNNIYGMGASPIIVDDIVVLTCDQSTGSFIAAFDTKTGRERWRTPRLEARSGHSTPVVYTPPGGRAQILVPGSFLLSAYEPRDGTRLWWVGGLSFEMKSTPVLSGDTLYINGFGSSENQPGAKVSVAPTAEVFAASDLDKDGRLSPEEVPTTHARRWMPFTDLDSDKHLNRDEWDYYKASAESENGMLAIRLGGRGDMTATAVRWRYQRGIPQLPSPLLYKDALYMVNDAGGLVTTLRPETGELIQQGRLKVPSDNFYASPVAGDGKIYIASENGKVIVLPPGGGLEALAVNDLQDNIYATPALVDGRIYLRTLNSLYCFGMK